KLSRKEKRRQEVARQKRTRLLTIWVPLGIVIVAIIGLLLYRIFEPELEGVLTFGTQSRSHDQEATFVEGGLPPTGGSHNPSWQNCGIYDTPVDNTLAVHSLEHGAVWLAYRSDLPTEKVEALRDLVRGKSYTLMAPYPDLDGEVVMSAWSRQLVIDSFPDDRVDDFINRYRQQGPEPGALCTGGVGSPIQ
ncbi:MAG: DUF3105 domain-containing protein, partial [Anaerolineae bacterium]